MKIQMPWKKKKILLERDLHVLEKRLASSLKPIEPRPEFVRNLRIKIVGEDLKKIIGIPVQRVQEGLLVAGGILSIAVVVFSGIRAVLAILSALGILQLKRKVEDTNKVPLHPAT
jgi:hypothetical protein